MADEEQVKLLKSGFEVWNQWRKDNPEAEVDFSGAQLVEVDLSYSDLKNADLSDARLSKSDLTSVDAGGADLGGASLAGADLSKANLDKADLSQVDLTGAVLTDASLVGAILSEATLSEAFLGHADLREANLRDADLHTSKGLQAHQLGGALTSLAKLPGQITSFEMLKVVKDASAYARKIFLAMLLGCAYTILTIATTTDVRLLTNSATTPLPIIQAQIPIVGFYFAAPLILLGFYLYFHLCMQNIWRRLATLPAELPDGRTLDQAADPWLLLGMVKAHFARLRADRTFLDRVQAVVSVALAYWVVPLTISLLWQRHLPRHEVVVTFWQIALLLAATALGIYYYRRAVQKLRGESEEAFSLKRSLKAWRRYAIGASATASVGLLCVIVSEDAINGVGTRVWFGGEVSKGLRERLLTANLVDADVSIKPDNWIGGGDAYSSQVRLVQPARLGGRNLRGMRASRAFLVRADLSDANLTGAELAGADMTGALVAGTRGLTRRLLMTLCANSPLIGLADGLSQPPPCPTYAPPNLARADLSEANLQGAFLQRADLSAANLTEAYLFLADLTEAHLIEANLDSADLTAANLTDADLTEANLIEASLRAADLTEARLAGANLTGVSLTTAIGLTQGQLDSACAHPQNPVQDLPEGLRQPSPCSEQEGE